MADGKVTIAIDGDSSGFNKSISGISTSISGLASSSLSSFNTLSTNIGKAVATGITLVAGAAITYGGVVVDLASDLQEVQNVVDVTFGESSSIIDQFAQDAGVNFGITELAAKQFTGTMGSMLTSMGLTDQQVLEMSTGLTGLTGDMASFYNLDHETAFEKIRSGISGETEPLKELGINMSVANLEAYALSQGLTTAYSSMTEAEKTMVRYNYLMDATANAQGDFANTSDSFANQLRILQLEFTDLGTSIGAELLPTMTDGLGVLVDFGTRLKSAFAEGGFSGLAVELGSVISDALNMVLEQAPALIEFVGDLIVSMGEQLLNNAPLMMENARVLLSTLVSAFQEMIPLLGDLVNTIVPLIAEALLMGYPLLWEAGIAVLTGIMTGISENLPMLIETAQEALESLVAAIVENLPILLQSAIDILLALVEFITDNVDLLLDAVIIIIETLVVLLLENLPILLQAAIDILLALVEFITDNVDLLLDVAITIIETLITGLVEALPSLTAMVPQIITAIVSALLTNLGPIISAAIQIIFAIIAGLIQAIPQLAEITPTVISAIVSVFTNTDWGQVGSDIISGIASGISNGVGAIKSAAQSAANSALAAAKSCLGIKSPSRKFRDEVGAQMSAGIGVGFEEEMPIDEMENALDESTKELSDKALYLFDGSYSNLNAGVARDIGVTTNNVSNSTTTTKEIGNITIKGDVNLDSKKVGEAVFPTINTKMTDEQTETERGRF